MHEFKDAKQLLTCLTEDGRHVLSIEADEVPEPKPGEVIVEMKAVPINPSDQNLLTAPADLGTARSETVDGSPALVADVEPRIARAFASRKGKKLPAGNEGAGVVVAAGSGKSAQALLGKTVTLVGGSMYRTFRCIEAMRCAPLPEGAPAIEGASLFVNPMTAQAFLDTMRDEGHTALVHTAAASNLGQMLAKLCINKDVPLVAIVRSQAQTKILADIGLTHVVDSSKPTFEDDLVAALVTTGATLGFDAIGGGTMADTILRAMERAQVERGVEVTQYGTTTHKQIYIYGRLDTSETCLTPSYGLYWGTGGWLVTPRLQAAGIERMMQMRSFAIEERNGIFKSEYTKTISLAEMIDPDTVRAYDRKGTGEKFLVDPSS